MFAAGADDGGVVEPDADAVAAAAEGEDGLVSGPLLLSDIFAVYKRKKITDKTTKVNE